MSLSKATMNKASAFPETTVAATNSSYIYNSLPSTGIKSFYSILGDLNKILKSIKQQLNEHH